MHFDLLIFLVLFIFSREDQVVGFFSFFGVLCSFAGGLQKRSSFVATIPRAVEFGFDLDLVLAPFNLACLGMIARRSCGTCSELSGGSSDVRPWFPSKGLRRSNLV